MHKLLTGFPLQLLWKWHIRCQQGELSTKPVVNKYWAYSIAQLKFIVFYYKITINKYFIYFEAIIVPRLTCISDFPTEEVWVTVFVQWSENRVRTSPNNWNFPVLWPEDLELAITDELPIKLALPALLLSASEGWGSCSGSGPLNPGVWESPFDVLSTTKRNSVNCFATNGFLSPWNINDIQIFIDLSLFYRSYSIIVLE